MNHVYKVVWNDVQCVWQCVSELTRSHSKKSQRERQERIASVQTQPTSFSQRAVMLALAAILGGVMVSPSALAATDGQDGIDQGNVLYHIDGSGNVNKAARDEFARVYKIVNPLSNNYAADGQPGSDGESGADGASYTVVPSQAQTVFHVSVSVEQSGGTISATQPARDGGNGANGTDGGNGGNGAKGSSHSEDGRTQTMYTNNMSSNEIQTAVNFLGKTFEQLKQEYATENSETATLGEVVKLEPYAPSNTNWSAFVFHGGRGGHGGDGGNGGNGGNGGQGEQGQTGVAIERGLTVGIYGGTISGGTGGRGGNGGTGGRGGNGGNGGQGGMGATIEIGGTHTDGLYTIKDSGGLEGGIGGNAGSAGTAGAGGNGGNGGNGGVGVYVDGATFITSSTITGGAGGSGGQAGSSGGAGSFGQAGQGGKNGWVTPPDAGYAANGEEGSNAPSTSGTTPTAGQQGRGGSAVLLDNEATLVLESGAQLIGGSGSTQGYTIEANGGGNKVQLNTELSNVTLTGGVSGTSTYLVLKGQDNTAYTITADQVASKFGSEFFSVLIKQGSSTWTVEGNLSPMIKRVAEVREGTLKLAANSALTKKVFVYGSSTLVIDKEATVTHVVLDDNSTLETNLASLSNFTAESLRNQGDNVTLKTTDNFTSSELVNQFHNWTVSAGISTAEGASQLAKGTTSVQNGAELTVKNVTLGANQTLTKQRGGTLTFEGESNFDNGTLTIDGDGAQFSERDAVLVTHKTSGDGIQNNLFGVNSSVTIGNKDKATLRTKEAFEAKDGFAHQFNKWEVQGTGSKATHADQLAKETDVQSRGALTLTDVTLGEEQTLALSGGDLTFAGTTNLDQGTKTFTSGTYRFADQAVLETALGSLSAVLNKPSATLGESFNATLRTKGPTFTSSADVAKFGTWEVQGAATTATGAEQLAKVTDVKEGGVMTITALTLGASQTLKLSGGKLTFAGLTNLDEGTKAFDSGKYGFADQAVLETTKASLTEVLGNVDTMELSSGATLRTKGGSFTSSADVTKFGTWEVQGAATTATGAEQLSKTTDVQSGGDLTVTDLTLLAGKTLKNTGGTLTFSGTTNVDEGELVLQSGTTKLASGATLVTNQGNADAIQSGAVRSLANREEATLQNDSAFESTEGFAGSFGNWLVNANAKTDSLALYGSELAENVHLDATAMNFIDRVVATNTGSTLTLNDARVVQGAVTGSGSLVKTGSGTLVLEKGNHRYTGTTEVQSGTLVLEKGANLAGDLTMASGSTLELSLLETNREAASRARRLRRALAEETAPSANHTVAGAATLANTAITVVSPTEYSQLAAERITIANGATLTIDARDFKGGTDRLENVLKATSDFTGEYASFSDNSLVFVLTPEYDPANHAMHLAVRPDTGAPEVQPGLSGKTNRMLLEGAMLMQRYLPLDPCMGQTRSSWAHALGGWEQQDGRADRAGYDATHYGVAAGGDVCVNRTKVGLNVAYLSSDAKSRNIAQTHNVNADTWQVGVYAIQPVADAWDVDAEAAYGHSSIRTDRVIASFGKLARSKTSADIFRAGLGLNYRFTQDALSLSPFVRADYVQVGTHGYREWNAEAFNLTVNRQSTKAIYASVGLRALYAPTERLTVKGKVAVAADLYNEGNDLTVAVRDAQDKPFTVQNPELGRFVGELGLGVGYQLSDRVSFSVDLQSLAGHDRWNVNAEAGVRVEF